MELSNKFDHPSVCKLNNQICMVVSCVYSIIMGIQIILQSLRVILINADKA